LSSATHIKVFAVPGVYEVPAEDANHWYTQNFAQIVDDSTPATAVYTIAT
jgi:hypothetical protein